MSEINGYEVLTGTGQARRPTNLTHMMGLTGPAHMEADPSGKSAHEPGSKLDQGKCAAGVLFDFALALAAVADVGDFGLRKYTRGGWQSVPNGAERYFDAMWRHLLKAKHEELDQDSGLPHLAHMAWNLLAVLELQGRGEK